MSLRAVDARFLLPEPPRTAVVIGGLPGIGPGLAAAGLTLHDAGAVDRPDLVVARAADAPSALRVPAASYLLLGGDARRAARDAGLEAVAYLAVPDLDASEYLVPIGQGRTVRYFYDYLRVAPRRVNWLRNRAMARVLGLGFTRLVPKGQLLTVAGPAPGPSPGLPAPLAAVDRATGRRASGWLLGLGPAHAERRVVFTAFEGRRAEPAWVAKLDRLPAGVDDPSDLPAAADPVGPTTSLVGAHMARTLAHLPFDGRRITVESAAVGFVLTDYLRGPFARGRKLQMIDEVVRWLVSVGTATAVRPGASGDPNGGRVEVASGAAGGSPVRAAATEIRASVPAVLEHGDLWSGNVVCRPGRSFTVVDWADADARGLPLRDLLYFLAETLAIVDGASTDAERDRHFLALCRGELPSSEVLFRAVRQQVDALGIEPASVGPLAAHCWADLSDQRVVALEATSPLIVDSMGPEAVEPAIRKAQLWAGDPCLGEDWSAWHGGPEPVGDAAGPVAPPVSRLRATFESWLSRAGWVAARLASQDATVRYAASPLMVLAPHPDDETLACGSWVARTADHGVPVLVIIATDGRHARHDVPPDQMAAVRRDELAAAVATLGVPADQVVWLGYEDGTLSDHVDELAGRISALVSERGPSVVLSPWANDTHPDHAALGAAGRIGTEGVATELCEYVVWAWSTPLRLIKSTIRGDGHGPGRRSPGPTRARRPVRIRTDGYLGTKRRALADHRSQLGPSAGEAGLPGGDGPLDARFLRRFLGPSELFFPVR